jgi:hypothetical protein
MDASTQSRDSWDYGFEIRSSFYLLRLLLIVAVAVAKFFCGLFC